METPPTVSSKATNSGTTIPITPQKVSRVLTYTDTENIGKTCKYCNKSWKSFIDHINKCGIFRASKEYPTYVDEDDNTSFTVTEYKTDPRNSIVTVTKDETETHMLSIKKNGKLATQTVADEPERSSNKRLNSQSPMRIVRIKKYLSNRKRLKNECTEHKLAQKMKLKEVQKQKLAKGKEKKKLKLVKRLNSQSPMRPMLRRNTRKKRSKQDEHDSSDDMSISQRSSTPDIPDAKEQLSDFDN